MEERARAEIGPWIARRANWDLYVTLTYDQRRTAAQVSAEAPGPLAPSAMASRRHAERWLAEVESEFGRSIGAVMAFERQKNGWPHWHGLLAAGGVNSAEFTAASAKWFRTRGFARFERVDRGDVDRIAAYCGKYLTKDYGDLLLVGLRRDGGIAGQQLLPGVPSKLEAAIPSLVAHSPKEA